MKRTTSFIIPVLALAMLVGLGTPVLARHEGDKGNGAAANILNQVENNTEKLEVEVKTDIRSSDDQKTRLERQKLRIQERRQKLEAQLQERRAEVKQRLEGRRLAVCENRETRINELLERSVENARRQLGVIQRLEEGIKKFYDDKQLTADGFDAAVANVDSKEADAAAAIDVMAGTTFDCTQADGNKPAGTITSLLQARHEGLSDYRRAVVDLLLVVKKALNDSKGESVTEQEGEPAA